MFDLARAPNSSIPASALTPASTSCAARCTYLCGSRDDADHPKYGRICGSFHPARAALVARVPEQVRVDVPDASFLRQPLQELVQVRGARPRRQVLGLMK